MLYFLLTLFLIICYGVFWADDQQMHDYLDKDRTDAIKGIFILIILFTHFSQYVVYINPGDILQRRILSFLGQGVVSMFLFYSGYGVTEAIKTKGIKYVCSLPRRRILSTLFRFNCAVLLFGILQICIGSDITWSKYILSMVAWDSLGNSNWYIFAIVSLYFFSYLCGQHGRIAKPVQYLLMLFVMIVLYCVALRWLGKGSWWYDTVLCYWLGMLWSLYKKEIENCLLGGGILYWVILIVALIGFVGIWYSPIQKLPLVMFRYLCLTIICVLLTMKLVVGNSILLWCGRNLFEIFILMRLPMIYFGYVGLGNENIYLYFVLSVVVTMLMVKPFQVFENYVLRMFNVD